MDRSMVVALVAGSLGLVASAAAESRALPFSDGGWKVEGKSASIGPFEGRDTLSVETGFATRTDVSLADGTIEFDVQLTRRRSFVYVMFRVQGEGEREEFYLRPHKSTLPDSVQYAPSFQDQSAWQLHHGPGATAAIAFEPGVWTHVRVVAQGSRAALFVGASATPVVIVPRLAREPRAGALAVGAFSPPGTPGQGPVARFANVTVRPEVDPVDWAGGPKATDPGPGTVRAWAVSKAFEPTASVVPQPPAVLGAFTQAAAEPEGLLALDRHVVRPRDDRAATAAARLHVKAASAGTRAFELGFSDVATVFLNGRAVFMGDASYSFDNPRRDGLIGFDQARLYLPLQAGDNELVVVVSDVFGGWGLMGRFLEPAGLAFEAR